MSRILRTRWMSVVLLAAEMLARIICQLVATKGLPVRHSYQVVSHKTCTAFPSPALGAAWPLTKNRNGRACVGPVVEKSRFIDRQADASMRTAAAGDFRPAVNINIAHDVHGPGHRRIVIQQ